MESHLEMKHFIGAAGEYSRHHADSSSSALQRHLQILVSTTDISDFDPVSTIASEFYVSLHELMTGLESHSILVWSGIAVLQKACTNPSAKKALIHTFKFIPVLTRFMGPHHIVEKQLKLLQVLVQLTYGVKITWQEAHLPYLTTTLVNMIMEGHTTLKPLALSILVNLTYKNLPALYVLMRRVESITKFIKSVAKLEGSPSIRMQVCKMMFILEQMKGNLPDNDILNFVDVAFSTVSQAFQAKDAFLLRHTVDFFKDVKQNKHFNMVMLKYPRYHADTKQLLELVEAQESADESTCECVSLVFEFFPSLLNLYEEGIVILFPRLGSAALRWVQNEATSIQSLCMIQAIVEQAKNHGHTEIKERIIEELKFGLEALLGILDMGQATPNSIEKRTKLTALTNLLTEMSVYPDLREEILSRADPEVILTILEDPSKQQPAEQQNLFQTNVSDLYVQTLSLVSSLAMFSSDWMSLYTKLLTQCHVQVSLAVALYTGSKIVKMQVFNLQASQGWTKECTHKLCDIMAELRLNTLAEGTVPGHTPCAPHTAMQDMGPVCNWAQESRLDELITALQQARNEDKIGDASTSAVMELYEYKLTAMGRSERRMQASLEAADASCIGMNHQIAQYRAELSRLHQMLFYSQQCIEGGASEKKELMAKLEQVTEQLDSVRKKQSAELKAMRKVTLQHEEFIIKKNQELELQTGKLSMVTSHCDQLKQDLQGQMQQVERLQGVLSENETKYHNLEKVNEELEDRLSKYKVQVADYTTKLNDLSVETRKLKQNLSQSMEESQQKDAYLAEKEKELTTIRKQVDNLERIRELVINVAGGSKNGNG